MERLHSGDPEGREGGMKETQDGEKGDRRRG